MIYIYISIFREEYNEARNDFKSQMDRAHQHIDTLTTQNNKKDEEITQIRRQVTKLEKDLATANQVSTFYFRYV